MSKALSPQMMRMLTDVTEAASIARDIEQQMPYACGDYLAMTANSPMPDTPRLEELQPVMTPTPNNNKTRMIMMKNTYPNAVNSAPENNWKLFKRSLANHPGVFFGLVWPFLAVMAIFARNDSRVLFAERSPFLIIATITICAFPWLPILITAWSLREQQRGHG